MKGHLSPKNVTKICPTLSRDFHSGLLSYGQQGEMELMDFVRNVMFEAAVKQAYGCDNVPQEKVH